MSDGVGCAVPQKQESEDLLQSFAKFGVCNSHDAECDKSHVPTHKRSCEVQNYILKVTLLPKEIVSPSITRTLSCPASASFMKLHEALQISFGWASAHLFEFRVKPAGSGLSQMVDVSPKFDLSLGPVKDVLIIDSGEEAGEEDFGNFISSVVTASDISIETVLGDPKYHGAVIEYEYAYCNCWVHEIAVVGRAAATDTFGIFSGEGHGAAEEVGGFSGWNELKEAYSAAVPNMRQRNLKNWYETIALNKDPQGLGGGREWVWDQIGVKIGLSRLRL